MKVISMITSVVLLALIAVVSRADAPSEAEMIAFSDAQEKAVDPGKTTIFKAAESGDLATITEYLADGGPVDCAQLYGGTMLYYAVRGRQAGIVKSLLAAGADPTAKHGILGWTPSMLLEHMTTKGGESGSGALEGIGKMLSEAEARARDNETEAEKLLEGAWDGDAVAAFLERKPSQQILSSLLRGACEHGDASSFKAVMASLTNISLRVREDLVKGIYDVDETLTREWLRAVEDKLNAVAYVHAKKMIEEGSIYRDGEPHNEGVSMHIDSQDNPPKRTVLMLAAARGNERLCRLLIESGADVSLCDAEGRTALDLACMEWGTPDAKEAIIKMLQTKGAAVR